MVVSGHIQIYSSQGDGPIGFFFACFSINLLCVFFTTLYFCVHAVEGLFCCYFCSNFPNGRIRAVDLLVVSVQK